jgi:hypothetical protein
MIGTGLARCRHWQEVSTYVANVCLPSFRLNRDAEQVTVHLKVSTANQIREVTLTITNVRFRNRQLALSSHVACIW